MSEASIGVGGARGVGYVNKLEKLGSIPEHVRADLRRVTERYVFRANDYYLGLIDWNDPKDPIRQLVIPRVEELASLGRLDASNEASNTVARGVQHKYGRTVLLLCNEVCGAYCRYCFRKRLFMDGNDDASLDITEGLEYIAAHPEVTNVLLSGGDPLMLSTNRLRRIIEMLRQIPHVRNIRIGTKMPAFNPWRVLDDPALLEMISTYSKDELRIYFMLHFDHPRELTGPAVEGVEALQRAGASLVNQCPQIRGVNDSWEVLGELFRRLSFLGVPQYYVFQCRPTAGNAPYQVPIAEAFGHVERARQTASGLGRSARFVMSHELGKIEICGLDERYLYLRFHQAKYREDDGRFLVCLRDDTACWLDALELAPHFGARGFSAHEAREYDAAAA